jgi:hypothetical protein
MLESKRILKGDEEVEWGDDRLSDVLGCWRAGWVDVRKKLEKAVAVWKEGLKNWGAWKDG